MTFLGDIRNLKPSKPEYKKAELYGYLNKLFSRFVEKSKIPYIINKATMPEWEKCFTHITYNPNVGENYETLESVGDKILSYCFKTFLYKKYPNITASQLNNLDQHYMSTHLQAMLSSSSMGLTNWLKVQGNVPRTSEKIQEDVLEAFFGTIDTIFVKNPNFGLGFGVRVCMKFVEKVFDIEMDMEIEPSKTFVKQLFVQIGVPDGVSGDSFSDQETGDWRTIVTINQEGIAALSNYGIRTLRSPYYRFEAVHSTKKPSEQDAYGQTMNFSSTARSIKIMDYGC